MIAFAERRDSALTSSSGVPNTSAAVSSGIPYLPGETPLDHAALPALINPIIDALKAEPAFARARCNLELGRWLVGPAGWLERGLELAGQSEAPPSEEASQAACRIFSTTLDVLEENEELRREVFGPCSIITECATLEDMLRFARSLEGQLTAAVHGTADDLRQYAALIRVLERKVGRIIFNGFGTGIEPCPSMHHGGPYPAASHSFFTSIGKSFSSVKLCSTI